MNGKHFAFIILALVIAAAAGSLSRRPGIFGRFCAQIGTASWYGVRSTIGKPTASGQKYDPNDLTAAHRHFPLGTKLNVINLNNERNVTVTINDRGPYVGDRVIDLSVAAARRLGMKKAGLAPVCLQVANQEKGPSE